MAFSFNLTEQSSFFAHYDILTQRPQAESGGRQFIQVTPDQWYFFEENITGTIRNPDLKPEKTIDYELGFQQKITDDSYVTFTAFYREMKDMIQIVIIASPKNEQQKLLWNAQFLYPHELENRYVQLLGNSPLAALPYAASAVA